jgi:deazaflavin-dependent oxidoreductase (nitroreductase family)
MSEEDEWNQKLIAEFRLHGGKVGGYFEGKTLLLLHTIGAKSGRERVNPTAYIRDGERFVIIASNSGAENHPAWYHNLIANPAATIEVGADQFHVTASIAQEPERTRLYNKMVAMMPIFEKYRREATRDIPVLLLTPVK